MRNGIEICENCGNSADYDDMTQSDIDFERVCRSCKENEPDWDSLDDNEKWELNRERAAEEKAAEEDGLRDAHWDAKYTEWKEREQGL